MKESAKDISVAKLTSFSHRNPSTIRRKKRQEIRAQSVFGGPSRKADLAKLRMDQSIFSNSRSASKSSTVNIKDLRAKLGIQL